MFFFREGTQGFLADWSKLLYPLSFDNFSLEKFGSLCWTSLLQVYQYAKTQDYKDHPALADPGPVVQRFREAIDEGTTSEDPVFVREVAILSTLSIYACSSRPSQVKRLHEGLLVLSSPTFPLFSVWNSWSK